MGEQSLKNIARPVRVYQVRLDAAMTPNNHPSRNRTYARAARQAIHCRPAVSNMSGDPEQEYFADGMVEEITTALSRVRWFFVIARNSSFTYKGRAVDVREVGRELGVRYVVEGSVRQGATGSASPRSSSMPRPATISGPSGTTATSRTSSRCRMRSRGRW